ncbi:MAG: hypothetical protein AAF541_13900 [Pseudomonadota bacterium]
MPKPQATLTSIAMRIATHILPVAESEYAQADAGLITQLLMTAAEDFERAVDVRMQDIQDIQEVLRIHADQLPNPAWLEILDKMPVSWKLSDVSALHDEALAILIELHAWAEGLGDQSLNREIWHLLRIHSERHKYALPPI